MIKGNDLEGSGARMFAVVSQYENFGEIAFVGSDKKECIKFAQNLTDNRARMRALVITMPVVWEPDVTLDEVITRVKGNSVTPIRDDPQA